MTTPEEGKVFVSPALALVKPRTVEERLETIEQQMETILTVMQRTETIISTVAKEVMPTIEALSNNPMIRGLLVGSKFGRKTRD